MSVTKKKEKKVSSNSMLEGQFINVLLSYISSSYFLFYADDLKLYCSIKSEMGSLLIQGEIDFITNRYHANYLDLNVNKCCIIKFSNNQCQYVIMDLSQ